MKRLTPEDALILYRLKLPVMEREESANDRIAREDFLRMRALVRIRRQCRLHLNILYNTDPGYRMSRQQPIPVEIP
jgi:hypothetical protein